MTLLFCLTFSLLSISLYISFALSTKTPVQRRACTHADIYADIYIYEGIVDAQRRSR